MDYLNKQQRLSNAITWLRFPLIFLIILLHCYSVERLEGNHDTYFKVLYPFSLWLGETGVPGFFFISGFLFFHSKKKYKEKLKSRVHTLLIPYLLWNLIILLLYLAVWAAGYPQNINGTSIVKYSITDYIRLFWDRGTYDDGNFVPLLCPLWYIRNLLIMAILSPILFYIIRFAREFFLVIVTIWWLMTYHNAFIPQTILFFSLGAYFAIFNNNPLLVFLKQTKLFLFLFAIFALLDILSHTAYPTPINLQIHRLSLIFNIPVLFLIADRCVQHGFTNKLLPSAAFIVFCIHYPIVVLLRKICIAQFADVPDSIHIILYFTCVFMSTILSIGFYLLLDKYLPNIKKLLSGNR